MRTIIAAVAAVLGGAALAVYALANGATIREWLHANGIGLLIAIAVAVSLWILLRHGRRLWREGREQDRERYQTRRRRIVPDDVEPARVDDRTRRALPRADQRRQQPRTHYFDARQQYRPPQQHRGGQIPAGQPHAASAGAGAVAAPRYAPGGGQGQGFTFRPANGGNGGANTGNAGNRQQASPPPIIDAEFVDIDGGTPGTPPPPRGYTAAAPPPEPPNDFDYEPEEDLDEEGRWGRFWHGHLFAMRWLSDRVAVLKLIMILILGIVIAENIVLWNMSMMGYANSQKAAVALMFWAAVAFLSFFYGGRAMDFVRFSAAAGNPRMRSIVKALAAIQFVMIWIGIFYLLVPVRRNPNLAIELLLISAPLAYYWAFTQTEFPWKPMRVLTIALVSLFLASFFFPGSDAYLNPEHYSFNPAYFGTVAMFLIVIALMIVYPKKGLVKFALVALVAWVLVHYGILGSWWRSDVAPHTPETVFGGPVDRKVYAPVPAPAPAVVRAAVAAQPNFALACSADRKMYTRDAVITEYAKHVRAPADSNSSGLPPTLAAVLGGNTSAGTSFGRLIDAEPISKVDAVYTQQALSAGITGIATVLVDVDKDGRPMNACVVNSPITGRPMLGYGLDDAAIAAINQWQFKPATIDGHPLIETTSQEFTFKR